MIRANCSSCGALLTFGKGEKEKLCPLCGTLVDVSNTAPELKTMISESPTHLSGEGSVKLRKKSKKPLAVAALVAFIAAGSLTTLLLSGVIVSETDDISADVSPVQTSAHYQSEVETEAATAVKNSDGSEFKPLEEESLSDYYDSGYPSASGEFYPNNDEAEDGQSVIKIWSYSDEPEIIMEVFKAAHPDFTYSFDFINYTTIDGMYELLLEDALVNGGEDSPDIYFLDSNFAGKFTSGDMSQYAIAYKDLGIDIDSKLVEAEIAQYAVDIGTRDGEVVALPYQSEAGAFIYRRSIAKDIWGTDSPDAIAAKTGPGIDQFTVAAEEAKNAGYAITSGTGDFLRPFLDSPETPWVENGSLIINPIHGQSFDIAKIFHENGYTNDTEQWMDPWYADMAGHGARECLGFFGPSWLLTYVINDYAPETSGDWAICSPYAPFSWGGTYIAANKATEEKEAVAEIIEWITLDTSETGFQYMWANGTLHSDEIKNTSASAKVMEKLDGSLDFIDGQDMYDVFSEESKKARGLHKTQYSEDLTSQWIWIVNDYVQDELTKDEAIDYFRYWFEYNYS